MNDHARTQLEVGVRSSQAMAWLMLTPPLGKAQCTAAARPATAGPAAPRCKRCRARSSLLCMDGAGVRAVLACTCAASPLQGRLHRAGTVALLLLALPRSAAAAGAVHTAFRGLFVMCSTWGIQPRVRSPASLACGSSMLQHMATGIPCSTKCATTVPF